MTDRLPPPLPEFFTLCLTEAMAKMIEANAGKDSPEFSIQFVQFDNRNGSITCHCHLYTKQSAIVLEIRHSPEGYKAYINHISNSSTFQDMPSVINAFEKSIALTPDGNYRYIPGPLVP